MDIDQQAVRLVPDINHLADQALELIFIHTNAYQDFNSIKLVSKRWNRICSTIVERMKKLFYEKCNNFAWTLVDEGRRPGHILSERCSHTACYHPRSCVMYMFGGCTSTYTAFNDLWRFDLVKREWERIVISKAPIPSPKALASLVLYDGRLILYGGFSKSSANPIHQTSTFYNEIHVYNKNMASDSWEEMICENTAPHLAGHTASIVGDFMIVFGGSMGSSYNNNVYVLDILQRIWLMPSIPGPCPPPRYGQSQLLLDNRHLVIIGGCGGPNLMFHDCWLLNFDLCGDSEWKWVQLKVENTELFPPYLWCHRCAQVGSNAVVVSRPVKHNTRRRRSMRRRGSSQSSSSVGGQRISSPDSPDRYHDRRAVAAAFANASLNNETGRRTDGRKLLYSKSLDEQEQQNAELAHDQRQRNPLMMNASSSQCSAFGGGSRLCSEQQLHRACSIPAIIVGEIPKLIVTASHCLEQQHTGQKATNTPSGFGQQDERPLQTRSDNGSHHRGGGGSTPKSVAPTSSLMGKQPPVGQHSSCEVTAGDAARNYYLSLLKEERDRLRIVMLAEELEQAGALAVHLDAFLSQKLPHLLASEKQKLVEETLAMSNDQPQPPLAGRSSRDAQHSGQLNSGRQKPTDDHTSSAQATSSQNERRDSNDLMLDEALIGADYHRQTCVYVLRLEKAIEDGVARWEQLAIEEDAPEDIMLYSLIAAKGELIMFGGMRTDGRLDSLSPNAMNMDHHFMSSDTYILRPRYSDM